MRSGRRKTKSASSKEVTAPSKKAGKEKPTPLAEKLPSEEWHLVRHKGQGKICRAYEFGRELVLWQRFDLQQGTPTDEAASKVARGVFNRVGLTLEQLVDRVRNQGEEALKTAIEQNSETWTTALDPYVLVTYPEWPARPYASIDEDVRAERAEEINRRFHEHAYVSDHELEEAKKTLAKLNKDKQVALENLIKRETAKHKLTQLKHDKHLLTHAPKPYEKAPTKRDPAQIEADIAQLEQKFPDIEADINQRKHKLACLDCNIYQLKRAVFVPFTDALRCEANSHLSLHDDLLRLPKGLNHPELQKLFEVYLELYIPNQKGDPVRDLTKEDLDALAVYRLKHHAGLKHREISKAMRTTYSIATSVYAPLKRLPVRVKEVMEAVVEDLRPAEQHL